MAEITITSIPKKRDIRDYLTSKKEPVAEPEVDLADRKLTHMAELTGVKDPEALLKLVRAVVDSCMAEEAGEEADEEQGEAEADSE